MELTPEQLDEARCEEALRLGRVDQRTPAAWAHIVKIAARLGREGWTPTDPDLLAVREIAASDTYWTSDVTRVKFRNGVLDGDSFIRIALSAYKAGKAAQ